MPRICLGFKFAAFPSVLAAWHLNTAFCADVEVFSVYHVVSLQDLSLGSDLLSPLWSQILLEERFKALKDILALCPTALAQKNIHNTKSFVSSLPGGTEISRILGVADHKKLWKTHFEPCPQKKWSCGMILGTYRAV